MGRDAGCRRESRPRPRMLLAGSIPAQHCVPNRTVASGWPWIRAGKRRSRRRWAEAARRCAGRRPQNSGARSCANGERRCHDEMERGRRAMARGPEEGWGAADAATIRRTRLSRGRVSAAAGAGADAGDMGAASSGSRRVARTLQPPPAIRSRACCTSRFSSSNRRSARYRRRWGRSRAPIRTRHPLKGSERRQRLIQCPPSVEPWRSKWSGGSGTTTR